MIQDFEPLSRPASLTAVESKLPSVSNCSSSPPSPGVVSDCVSSLAAPGTGVLSTLSVMASGLSAAELSQVAILPDDLNSDPNHFPSDELDFNGQQVDLRHSNTWVLPLDQVSSAEAAEVHIINALAPFILNSKLKALMCKSGDAGFIINVSSMEGRFASYKEPVHPHTNMAKAALNMMTCTSAKDYAFAKIYMNSVDTGWVTEENPAPLAARKSGFGPPLDEIDGAARILDPIFTSLLLGRYEFGRFYKDYKHSRWEFAHHDQQTKHEE
jgi:NAD(P)-dependent dehydrogenase (short-subunit alcohol dehydrogenase family)